MTFVRPHDRIGFSDPFTTLTAIGTAESFGANDYRALFELNPTPMWVYDVATHRILAANEAALNVHSSSRDELLGRNVFASLPEDSTAPATGMNGSWLHRTNDGTWHEVITSQDVPFADRTARLLVARNVTAHRQSVHDLCTANAQLESRLAERMVQFEVTRKELELFSFSVSHDLRAPLRSITGFARILLEQYSSAVDLKGQRLLRTVQDEARRMIQLIDDISAFSRVARQPMDPAMVDMTELARCTFQTLVESTPGIKAQIELGPLPPAFGDRTMLRQVLVNLLGNAVKFSSRQDEPRIEVSGFQEAGKVVYCIKDNGVGFDPRYAAKLFGIFQRLHSQSDFEGTGIGLALAQRIIHRHQGAMWGEGKIQAGASFYFSLPGPAATAVCPD